MRLDPRPPAPATTTDGYDWSVCGHVLRALMQHFTRDQTLMP
ncbi:MAG: hypothetical protein WCH05_02715 [Chlorobiaceae bacterium]